ncbi:hypothetical protein GCM10027596_18640 [Nocardioides korecus]
MLGLLRRLVHRGLFSVRGVVVCVVGVAGVLAHEPPEWPWGGAPPPGVASRPEEEEPEVPCWVLGVADRVCGAFWAWARRWCRGRVVVVAVALGLAVGVVLLGSVVPVPVPPVVVVPVEPLAVVAAPMATAAPRALTVPAATTPRRTVLVRRAWRSRSSGSC